MNKTYYPWCLSALSGILLTLGFPNFYFFFLTWLALVPLLLAVRGKSRREAFFLGYFCGLIHYGSTLYWIIYVVNHYGGIPLPAAATVLFILCGYMAFYPASFAWCAALWIDSPRLWFWCLPAVWVVLEWLRAHLLTGFPWASLGYTQTPFQYLVQTADVWGVYGVSWLVVSVNVCLVALLRRHCSRISLACVIGCLLISCGYGYWRVDTVTRKLPSGDQNHLIGLIQGNIDQSRKWDPEYQQVTIEKYARLSDQALLAVPETELLVWPETAMPFFYGINSSLTAKVKALIRNLNTPVVFGVPGVVREDGHVKLQNKALLVDSTGRVVGQYAKRHLVPFGEYVPLGKVLFFVHRLVTAAGDFVPGTRSEPLRCNSMQLGVLICYEAIFPELTRQEVMQGATILVNITNDAWYGRTSAPYQHLQIARWRAIESRTPLVRCANTGVSAIIDAAGNIQASLPLDTGGYLVGSVDTKKIGSFYTCYGDLFVWICALMMTMGMVYSALKSTWFPLLRERFKKSRGVWLGRVKSTMPGRLGEKNRRR